MICVLGEPEDRDVLWLAAALRRRGEDAQFVLPDELRVGSALTVRIDAAAVSSSLRLRDGRVIGADTPCLVVNRLVDGPVPADGGAPADARYLAEEWRAATAAWLRTMRCPVLNPPRAASLAGPVLPDPAWRAVASAHGVPVRPWRSDRPTEVADPVHVVSLGTRCLDPTGSAPAGLAASLAAIGRYTGTPLLGATFDRVGDRWEFVAATPRPALEPFGAPLVEAVVAHARAFGCRS